MNLCLLFHCLCDSYEDVSSYTPELFVSLTDLEEMIYQLRSRDYSFGQLDLPGKKTATITFDDGYYNNILFESLAQRYGIPYLLFVSAYYSKTGVLYPWFLKDSPPDTGTITFDYYQHFKNGSISTNTAEPATAVRPMSFPEMKDVLDAGLAEIGCHGFHHQPLTQEFERYLQPERDSAMTAFDDALGIRPRYFSLANGAYTKSVMKILLETFDRVFTIEGRPYRRNARIIHRITLINPAIAGPLIQQIDQHLKPLRQVRRAVRSFCNMHTWAR